MQNTSVIDLQPRKPNFEACPSCDQEIVRDQKECFSCGIIFKNFENYQFEHQMKMQVGGIEHLSSKVLRSLDQRWKRLVVNYHDNEAHHGFIRRCVAEEAVPFAVYCYTKMLEIDSEDDIAMVMRKQSLGLLTVKIEVPAEKNDERPPSSVMLKWVLWLGIFLSSMVVVVGTTMPQMRNLVGLGVSLLFLFLFANIYRRNYFS